MNNTFRLVCAIVMIVCFSRSSYAQRQTKLYIDDGNGNFYILTAPSGGTGGTYTLPSSGLTFPAANAVGVLTNPGNGVLTWSSAPSGSGSMLIAMNSGGNLVNNAFLEQGGSQVPTESQAQIVATRSGTLKNFFVNLTAAPGFVWSRIFTVRINGVNSALSVTIPSAASTGSDITDNVTVNAFDLISIQQQNVGSAAASVGMASFELAY